MAMLNSQRVKKNTTVSEDGWKKRGEIGNLLKKKVV